VGVGAKGLESAGGYHEGVGGSTGRVHAHPHQQCIPLDAAVPPGLPVVDPVAEEIGAGCRVNPSILSPLPVDEDVPPCDRAILISIVRQRIRKKLCAGLSEPHSAPEFRALFVGPVRPEPRPEHSTAVDERNAVGEDRAFLRRVVCGPLGPHPHVPVG
jgi:hypothetical protein